MPAKSKAQQAAMGIARAVQKGERKATPGSPSAKIAKSMKPKDVEDFASTPTKGLPQKVKKEAAPHQAYTRSHGYDPRGPGGRKRKPKKEAVAKLREYIRKQIREAMAEAVPYHVSRKSKNILFKVGQEVTPAKWGDQRYPASGKVVKVIAPGAMGKVKVKWVNGKTDVVNTNELIGINRPAREGVVGEAGKKEKMAVQCMECGKKFKTSKTFDVKCPKCGGYDVDLAEAASAPDGIRLKDRPKGSTWKAKGGKTGAKNMVGTVVYFKSPDSAQRFAKTKKRTSTGSGTAGRYF